MLIPGACCAGILVAWPAAEAPAAKSVDDTHFLVTLEDCIDAGRGMDMHLRRRGTRLVRSWALVQGANFYTYHVRAEATRALLHIERDAVSDVLTVLTKLARDPRQEADAGFALAHHVLPLLQGRSGVGPR